MKWISTQFYGGKSAVQLILQLAALFSGITWTPFMQACNFMKLAIGSRQNFFRYAYKYTFK